MASRSVTRGEAAAWAGLVLGALVLRLVALPARPFQFDEGQVAYFAWRFAEVGDYHYQPVLHGPLMYYLTALSLKVLGATDFTARLPFALCGTVVVALPFLLRRRLGRVAALAAALLLAISPTFLYYSRFAREDIVVTCLTFAAFVVAVRLFDRPRRWHPAALGALLAGCFATKESTYITIAIAGVGLVGGWIAGFPVRQRLTRLRARDWLAGVAAFCFVYALLFSVFFTRPGGVVDGLIDGPKYWVEQHPINRGGEDPPFYLALLAGHEWLVVLLGAAGVVAAVRLRRALDLYLVWWFVSALAAYSFAGERFAWLALQPLLPLVLLAGVGFQALWAWTGARRVALVAVGGLALLVFTAVAARTVYERGADPRELEVVVPTSDDVSRTRDDLLALMRRRPATTVEIDTAEANQFPWAWYLRDKRIGFIDMTLPGYTPRADVLLVSDGGVAATEPKLAGYRGRRYRIREWWIRDYGGFTPAGYVRWQLHRTPFGQVGETGQSVYVRRGL